MQTGSNGMICDLGYAALFFVLFFKFLATVPRPVGFKNSGFTGLDYAKKIFYDYCRHVILAQRFHLNLFLLYACLHGLGVGRGVGTRVRVSRGGQQGIRNVKICILNHLSVSLL
jgi:hypothetical protein